MRASSFMVLTGAAVAATLVACSPPDSDSGGQSITIADDVSVNWDPFNGANVFLPVAQAVYDPLIMVSAEGEEPQPWLAESFEISRDGLKMSVKLRRDIEFIDGIHMDAPGVEKYFDALFASDGYSWKPRVVDQFGAEVSATGKYTLDITTTTPISYRWLWQFGLTPVASPATVGDPDAFADGPVGTGPYIIAENEPDVSLTFERNPDYWNPEAYPYDEVTIHEYDDPVAAMNAIKSGQLDAAQVDLPLAQEARSTGYSVFEGPGNIGTLFVSDHNGDMIPALGDIRVRQAMNMAIDREAILKATNLGMGSVSSQPFQPGQLEYVEGGDDRYPYDIQAARELMAEAGYADGFEVTIPSFHGHDIYGAVNTVALEPIVQSSLADIGIRVTYETFSGEVPPYTDTAWKSGKYPLLMLNMPPTNWVSAFDDNWSGYNDPELEALSERFKLSRPAEQEAVAQEIGEFLLEKAWYVPFSRPASPIATVPEVQVQIDGAYTNPKLWQYTPKS